MVTAFIAECQQEVSTFNPVVPGRSNDFSVRFSRELLEYTSEIQDEIGGAISFSESRTTTSWLPHKWYKRLHPVALLLQQTLRVIPQDFWGR